MLDAMALMREREYLSRLHQRIEKAQQVYVAGSRNAKRVRATARRRSNSSRAISAAVSQPQAIPERAVRATQAQTDHDWSRAYAGVLSRRGCPYERIDAIARTPRTFWNLAAIEELPAEPRDRMEIAVVRGCTPSNRHELRTD